MPERIEKITAFRLQLDAAMNSFPYLMPSREVSLCSTNLQRSFMWLGEALKATGSPTPYFNSSNQANATIEPQADHKDITLMPRWESIDQTQTARVKDFRYYLEQLIQKVRYFIRVEEDIIDYENEYYEYLDCIENSYWALKEAKCWLGWELNRIKKAKEALEQSSISPIPKPLSLPL